jgi:hypothetical protein
MRSKKGCEYSGTTIFLRSLGGVGNQIFVYAFAKWLGSAVGARTVLFDPGSDAVAGRSTRAIQLQHLFHDAYILRGAPANLIDFFSLSRKYQAWIGPYALRHFRPSSMAECDALVAQLRSEAGFRWPVFSGYFQYEALVRAQLHELRSSSVSELRRRMNALQDQGRLHDLQPERDCVIHVRRGDYKSFQGFNLLDSSYYRNADVMLRREGFSGRLFYVSDETSEAAQVLEGAGLRATPLALEDPIDALSAVAQARFKVIANSTLSLWGALLGRADAMVAFPADWPQGSQELAKLCSEQGWIECRS